MSTTARLAAALAGRYTLERELGQGGMATVFLAEDVRHGRKVAIKVVHAELAAVLGAERFLSEIKTTAALQHPHILPLHDSGEADGQLFYVMPFVDGESLRDRLTRETQLPVDEAVRLASEVADALGYAHARGVVHRDIKPENILLQGGHALVADFGIALAVQSAGGTRLTQTGLSLGTPQYMAPEQATGERTIDARADVYALGAVTYEMLTGEPPFTAPTAQGILARVLTEEPTPPTARRRTIPAHVEAAVLDALQKLPADRCESAAHFAKALRDAGAVERTRVLPSRAASGGAVRPTRRELTLMTVAAVAVAAALWGWLRPPAPIAMPVTRFQLTLDEPSAHLSLGGPFSLAIARDGRRWVYTAQGDSGPVRLVARELGSLDAKSIPGTENAYGFWLSPSGESIAFFSGAPPVLSMISIARGTARTVATDSLVFLGGAWGDDERLYLLEAGGSVYRIGDADDTREVVARADTTQGTRAWSMFEVLPGRRAALVHVARSGSMSREFGVLDFNTGRVTSLGAAPFVAYAASGHLLWPSASGQLLAARFDLKRLELTSPATPTGIQLHRSASFAVAANGTLVYAPSAPPPAMRPEWVERDGRSRPVDPDWVGYIDTPALSPDDSRLAVSITERGVTQVWVKRLDRGPLTALTPGRSFAYRPRWSADGRSVFYIATDPDVVQRAYMAAADGSADERPLSTMVNADEIERSADGSVLILRTGVGARRDIYLAASGADSSARPLVATAADEYSPALSSNGRWLAYVSAESGRPEVYVRPFPNTQAWREQVSLNGANQPVWAHGGRELFFRDAAGVLVAATVDAGPPFRIVERRVLFPAHEYVSDAFHPAYAVSRDDRRFVFIRGEDPAFNRQLVVVQNWFQELRRLGAPPP